MYILNFKFIHIVSVACSFSLINISGLLKSILLYTNIWMFFQFFALVKNTAVNILVIASQYWYEE